MLQVSEPDDLYRVEVFDIPSGRPSSLVGAKSGGHLAVRAAAEVLATAGNQRGREVAEAGPPDRSCGCDLQAVAAD